MYYKIRNSLIEDEQKEFKSDMRFLAIIGVLTAIFFAIVIVFNEVFITVTVDGPSMQPNYYTGDVLLVNKAKTPEYGDVVIVDLGEKWLIKRVVAKGGDTVELKDGYVYRNGEKLIEDYVKEQGKTIRETLGDKFVLGNDEIFYLGDNRAESRDARHYGACTTGEIVGVVENDYPFVLKFGTFLRKLFYGFTYVKD